MTALLVRCLISILLITLIFNIGCKKDSYTRELRAKYNEALNKVELGCSEQNSILYFSAELNGKKVCYHDGEDGYHASFRNAIGVVTSEPYFNV